MSFVELYPCCSCYVLASSLPVSSSRNQWKVPPFCTHYQKNSTSCQVFSVNCPVFGQLCWRIDVIFHKSQTYSKFGQQLLVMMNYPWDFSQSEKEKYFKWIIMTFIQSSFRITRRNMLISEDFFRLCLRPPWIKFSSMCIILHIKLSLIQY